MFQPQFNINLFSIDLKPDYSLAETGNKNVPASFDPFESC